MLVLYLIKTTWTFSDLLLKYVKNNGSIACGFCSHHWPLPRH
jgi:hypothetical protein